MRTPLVAGNWKMNGNRAMAQKLCAGVVEGMADLSALEVVLCPPYPLLTVVSDAIAAGGCLLGAQDMDENDNGALTGQVSAAMLLDCGCKFVIVGHSERRTIFGESDALVARKAEKALSNGLATIVCVGETREQRDSGVTHAIVGGQIQAVIDQVGIAAFGNIVIAYEPVWAIGTGLTATPDQAQQIHKMIRQQLTACDEHIGAAIRILYGGSMKPDNAAELIAKPDIDGGLIGGAALQVEDFLAICKAASQ